MPNLNQRETHPLARLGVDLSELLEKTKAKSGVSLARPNVWAVMNRRRDGMSYESYAAVKSAFPDFDIDAAMKWRWSEHGGRVRSKARSKRSHRTRSA